MPVDSRPQAPQTGPNGHFSEIAIQYKDYLFEVRMSAGLPLSGVILADQV